MVPSVGERRVGQQSQAIDMKGGEFSKGYEIANETCNELIII